MGLCEMPSVRISNLFTESVNQLTVSIPIDLQICRRYGILILSSNAVFFFWHSASLKSQSRWEQDSTYATLFVLHSPHSSLLRSLMRVSVTVSVAVSALPD